MKKTKNDNSKNLFELFCELEDCRRAQGRVHQLPVILLMATMAIMSGFVGQREMGNFVKKNRKALIKCCKLKKRKVPSRKTLARALSNVDFEQLSQIFHKWAMQYVDIGKKEWISLDGKAIGGTVTNPHNEFQLYVNLVSAFVSKRKQVLSVEKVEDKNSEIPVVRNLIEMLDLEGVIFTIDALHCQKETTKKIIETKNDYVIGVKGNQRKLYATVKKTPKKPSQEGQIRQRKRTEEG